MSRLTIDLTDAQHKKLKAFAALQGKTIKAYAVERLFPADETVDWTEDEKAAWGELMELLDARVASALAGNISTRSILDIAEDGMRRHKAA